MTTSDETKRYGVSPALSALPLMREWNAKIDEDSPERAAELRAAMRVISEEEEED